MNQERRKKLCVVVRKLNEASAELEGVRDDEDESRENMPENLQNSDRYLDSETASETMDDAIGLIGEAVTAIDGIL